ncbi:hypothetical protein LXL04_000629 [Taraxacum kok-saghyz]
MSAGGKRFWSAESKRAFVFWKTKVVCRGKNACRREDMVQGLRTERRFPQARVPPVPSLFSPDRTTIAITEISGADILRDPATLPAQSCSTSTPTLLPSAPLSSDFSASFLLPSISQVKLMETYKPLMMYGCVGILLRERAFGKF